MEPPNLKKLNRRTTWPPATKSHVHRLQRFFGWKLLPAPLGRPDGDGHEQSGKGHDGNRNGRRVRLLRRRTGAAGTPGAVPATLGAPTPRRRLNVRLLARVLAHLLDSVQGTRRVAPSGGESLPR